MKYYLKKHEAFQHGLQRVERALLLQASREAVTEDLSEAGRVHLVRKRLKRARAIHKLARPALVEAVYRRDQVWFRDRGRRLSEARDLEVMVQTHRRLAHRAQNWKAGSSEDLVAGTLRRLICEAHVGAPPNKLLNDVAEELIGKAAEWDTVSWISTTARLVRDALTSGIEHYALALGDVERCPTGERIHTLRKRVKDLAYQMDFMARRNPGAGKRLRRKGDELGKLLGWHHDVWLFADRLRAVEELPGSVRNSWVQRAETEEKRVVQRVLAKMDDFRRALARKTYEV